MGVGLAGLQTLACGVHRQFCAVLPAASPVLRTASEMLSTHLLLHIGGPRVGCLCDHGICRCPFLGSYQLYVNAVLWKEKEGKGGRRGRSRDREEG